jgi:hypothetical protein
LTRTDSRNARLLQAGDKLTNYVAPLVTNAVAALRERLSHLDGYTGGGEQGGRVQTSDTSTPTERIAAQRYMYSSIIEDLRTAIEDCCHTIDLLGRMADDALRDARPDAKPVEAAVCRDQQHGKDGVLEWGDVLCMRSSVKAGLCMGHYLKWYRWRTNNGVDTSKDFAA